MKKFTILCIVFILAIFILILTDTGIKGYCNNRVKCKDNYKVR
jgi:hypothetical protein